MAIGIFVSMTPFFPFHTAIAMAMSVILRGSKRAAAVGVWLSNPLTIPLCYFIIYKLGIFILGTESLYDPEWKTFADILQMGVEMVYAMIIGGCCARHSTRYTGILCNQKNFPAHTDTFKQN